MKIPCYVILGSQGMYSDWTQWPVKVIICTEDEANAECQRIEAGITNLMKMFDSIGRSYVTPTAEEQQQIDAFDPSRHWISDYDQASYTAVQVFIDLSDLEILNNVGLQMMEESARLENIQHALS